MVKEITKKQELIQIGVSLLDKVTHKYLDFTRTYKRAKEILWYADVESEKVNYIIGKLKSQGKDFASLYCNLDAKHRRIVLDALHIYYDDKPGPDFSSQKGFQKYLTEMDRVRDEEDYIGFWQIFNFKIKFLDKWLVLAFNNNPETFLSELSIELWNYYEVSKIKNYGSAENWGKFWVWMKERNIKQRTLIVEKIITDPLNF